MKTKRWLIMAALVYTFLPACTTNKKNMTKEVKSAKVVAGELNKIGYEGLFMFGERSLADSVWQDGRYADTLMALVTDATYDSYTRLLASEILYAKDSSYPPKGWEDSLAVIYTGALRETGSKETSRLSGNLWGMMYYQDSSDHDYGVLGQHLMATGTMAVPNLTGLLNDSNKIVYEGSREAMTGNRMNYRVKDAAAYYIGQIAGIKIPFHDSFAERDAEIEKLKQQLAQ